MYFPIIRYLFFNFLMAIYTPATLLMMPAILGGGDHLSTVESHERLLFQPIKKTYYFLLLRLAIEMFLIITASYIRPSFAHGFKEYFMFFPRIPYQITLILVYWSCFTNVINRQKDRVTFTFTISVKIDVKLKVLPILQKSLTGTFHPEKSNVSEGKKKSERSRGTNLVNLVIYVSFKVNEL